MRNQNLAGYSLPGGSIINKPMKTRELIVTHF
jgi:hypothetical protein